MPGLNSDQSASRYSLCAGFLYDDPGLIIPVYYHITFYPGTAL